jgi:hypothetical protein
MHSSHLLTFNSSVLSSLFPIVQSYLLIYGRPPDPAYQFENVTLTDVTTSVTIKL